jgi:hypothetical protein
MLSKKPSQTLRSIRYFFHRGFTTICAGRSRQGNVTTFGSVCTILRNLIQKKLREEYIRLSDPSLRMLESSTHAIQIPASPTFFFRVFRFPLLAALGDILKSCAGSNSCSKLTELWGVSCGHASQSA